MAGGPHLSLIWQHTWDGSDKGSGVILGNDYEIQKQLLYPGAFGAFDIHEFHILDDGNTSLSVTYRSHKLPMGDFGRPKEQTSVLAGGFAEMDVHTGDVIYDWDSVDQIPLRETVHFGPGSPPSGPPGWDYVHANSIDKNSDGNYIMSMRFTNTVYMISGENGRIMWRLRGTGKSDFDQDFTFSKQHDAKFLESNGTHHVISLLNNASDEGYNDENVSSALIIELETSTTPKTARVLRRYNRPDGKLTRLRGNAQVLPNKNIFIGWSERGYFSEHAEDGELLLTANFASSRFSTYRAYKSEFIGRPRAPPALVASVSGTDEKDLTTTFHVSWNGATDIAWWNLYARAESHAHPVLITSIPKHDFETMYIAKGYLDWVSAEAVDKDGNVLRSSDVHRSETPRNWGAVGFSGNIANLKPHDPAMLYSLDGSGLKEEVPDEEADVEPDAETDKEADEEANKDESAPSSDLQSPGEADSKELSRITHETYSVVSKTNGLYLFIMAVLIIGGICAGGYLLFCRRRSRSPYRKLPRSDDFGDERVRLHAFPE